MAAGRILPPMLKLLHGQKYDPVVVNLVDNHKFWGEADKDAAYRFLKEYHLHVDESPVRNIIPNMFEQGDYEGLYLSPEEQRVRGNQGVASANFMGVETLRVLDKFIFDHPVFGELDRNVLKNCCNTVLVCNSVFVTSG